VLGCRHEIDVTHPARALVAVALLAVVVALVVALGSLLAYRVSPTGTLSRARAAFESVTVHVPR
jgi:hypothetical protein